MGFINYRGTKEKHYGEVVEYADIQDELERQKRDEIKKAEWYSSFSGNSNYASADTGTLIRLAVKAYRDASDHYRKLKPPYPSNEPDPLQLWQDLWLYRTAQCMESMEIPKEKQNQLLRVITEKMLHLGGRTSVEQHVAESDNRRYQRYLKSCFSFNNEYKPVYWCWLASNYENGREILPEILIDYENYGLYLRYYLYKSVHPKADRWIVDIENERAGLNELKLMVRRNQVKQPSVAKLKNPLYQQSILQNIPLFTHVLLFRFERTPWEEDLNMIEDLYVYLKENAAAMPAITSILPADIEKQIQKGKLPVFSNASITGLQPGESIHYMDHVIIYKPLDCGEEPFQAVKGTIAITDKRIAFRCAGVSDIPLRCLYKVIQYDMDPGMLELQGKDQTCYAALPDLSSAYKVLQMTANPESKTVSRQEEKVPFSYQELVEKADLGACIFAFECLEEYPFPEDFRQRIGLLLKKLHGLKAAVENHPDRLDEAVRFLSYYLPEAVRLMLSYHEYQSATLDEKMLQKTFSMISDSIDTLDAAVEQKILSIYKMETMETQAKADALRQILEQDGYTRNKQFLKH